MTRASNYAERIARTLFAPGSDERACAEVQAALPDYVAQELRGVPVAQRFPDLTQHLLTCAECSALHAALLGRELSPALPPLPPPDVAALRARWQQEGLAAFVTGLTEKIIARVRDIPWPDLREQADIFFDAIGRLGAAWWSGPLPGGALSLAGPSQDEPGLWLAATYVATRRVAANELSPQRSAELRRKGTLAALIRTRARQAARDAGLSKADAERFAEEYTRLITAPGASFPPVAP